MAKRNESAPHNLQISTEDNKERFPQKINMTGRPNIIIFLADDLGYHDLSCYGNRDHHTPNLDALAAGGMRFTDCHSNGSVCSPTRAALLTGRYQQRSGIEHVLGPDPAKSPGMAADEPTFAHLFRDAGYATGMFGKYHTGHIPHQSPNKMGFDVFRGMNGGMDHHSRFNRWGSGVWYHDETLVEYDPGYSTELICDHAISFMEHHAGQPFLLYIADWMVHFPWQGPNDPPDFAKGVDNSAPEKKYGSVKDRKRAYREMVEALDGSVGRVMESVRKLGIEENTLFIFTSDNGGHHLICDNLPLRGHKGDLFEGGHRVPAIACWPGQIEAGSICDETIMLFDLMPTMLELTGIEPPADRHLDGTSLLPVLRGEGGLPERTIFWRMGSKWAVRQGCWKAVCHGDEPPQLYELSEDIGETRDLAHAYPQRVQEMIAAFEQWERDVDRDSLDNSRANFAADKNSHKKHPTSQSLRRGRQKKKKKGAGELLIVNRK